MKAGAKVTKNRKSSTPGLLHLSPDWTVVCDLHSKLVVPPFLAVTRLRPDLLLYSVTSKTCIILELTCCCEENIEEWHKKKFFKYDSLRQSIITNGWKVHLFPVEVGARGYCGTSVKSCFLRLGFSNKLVRSLLKSLSLSSIKASFHIWQCRENKDWNTPLLQAPNSNVYQSNVTSSKFESEAGTKKKASNSQKRLKKATSAPRTSFNVGIFK